MSRLLRGAAVVASLVGGLSAVEAGATDLPYCPPVHHHRHHVAARHHGPDVVYGRAYPRPGVAVEGGIAAYQAPPPPPVYGQQPSWLDGYGTRPVNYPGYGTYDVYAGSAQVLPAIPPAGGLAVYSAGAYGPGPTIIRIPPRY